MLKGGFWEAGIILGVLGGRGGTGGEVCGVKVLWSSSNSSPEFCLAAADSIADAFVVLKKREG
jgi:hypothetical protein